MLSRSFKFLYLLSSSVAKVVNPLFPLSDPLYDYNYTYFNFDKLLEYDLDQLQNPDTCSSSPLLIFDLKTLEGEGWGGILLHAAGTLAQAYYEGRTMVIIEDSPMPYSIPQSDCTGSQWQCFFEPLSSCALNESATSKELADYHQRGKSIVLGYMVDLSTGHKWINSMQQMFSGRVKERDQHASLKHRLGYSHPLLNDAALYTCPPKYREMNVPNCDQWWAGQMMKRVFTLMPALQTTVNDYILSNNLSDRGYVGLHVRRGDAIDCQYEKRIAGHYLQSQYGWDAYLDLAKHVSRMSGKRKIFVATDDPEGDEMLNGGAEKKKNDKIRIKNKKLMMPLDLIKDAVTSVIFADSTNAGEKPEFKLSDFGKFSRNKIDATKFTARNRDKALAHAIEALADLYLLSNGFVFVGATSSTFGAVASILNFANGGLQPQLIDNDDILWNRHNHPVTGYLLFKDFTFDGLSNILSSGESPDFCWYNSTTGLPQYDPELLASLFPTHVSMVSNEEEITKTNDDHNSISQMSEKEYQPLGYSTNDLVFKFDIEKFDFAKIIKEGVFPQLGDRPLDKIHEIQTQDNVKLIQEAVKINLLNDSLTEFHDAFWGRVNEDDGWPEFRDTFNRFVSEVVAPIFPSVVNSRKQQIVHQVLPGFRVHLPGSKTIFLTHADGDSINRHPTGETNFLIQLSQCTNSAMLWVESLPNLGDFHPVDTVYGELFMFDGNSCRHKNLINREVLPDGSQCTRVSLDFRAMSEKAYETSVAMGEVREASFDQKRKYVLGEYYTQHSMKPGATPPERVRFPRGGDGNGTNVNEEQFTCAVAEAVDAVGALMGKHSMNNPWGVVDLFEKRVAAYAGSKYAVAVSTCTDALFLSLKYLNATGTVTLPARTYVSVPGSVLHAGLNVKFDAKKKWEGSYELTPFNVVDGAVRFTSGMYITGSLHCVSFHRRKHLPIGKGGMILTDDLEAVKWLKLVRYNGRDMNVNYDDQEHFDVVGWNMYMTPEQAARGIELLENLPEHNSDLADDTGYSDLGKYIFDKIDVENSKRRDV